MLKEYQAQLGDFMLGRKLGTGACSKVREATRGENKYAAKYMKKTADLYTNKSFLDLVYTEAKVLSQLDHPSIVKLHEFSDNGFLNKSPDKKVPVLYLVFDLVTGGELFDYVALTGRFSDKLARYFFKQLINALEFLHSKGFAHRDIKAENILMDSTFAVKLADFGFSAPLAGKDGTGKLHSGKGTLGYMAPELHSGHPYAGDKVDIFAMGVLLFIMMAQHPPFLKATQTDGYYKMFCADNEKYWAKVSANKPPGTFSPPFKSLINGLLAYNPAMRLAIKDIKAHPWLNGPEITPEELNAEFTSRKAKLLIGWKEKAAEALAKKQQKAFEMSKKKAAMGGYAAHIATKATIAEKKTTLEGVKRFIEDYKVIWHF